MVDWGMEEIGNGKSGWHEDKKRSQKTEQETFLIVFKITLGYWNSIDLSVSLNLYTQFTTHQ